MFYPEALRNPPAQRRGNGLLDAPPVYHIAVVWSDDDGCWVASVPELKPCSAHGDDPVEAVRKVQNAIAGVLGD
jgi:hypothetical protein